MSSRKSSFHRKRADATPKPVVFVATPEFEATKRLPNFGSGIVITIPLNLWPAYQELHHLEIPGGYNEQRVFCA